MEDQDLNKNIPIKGDNDVQEADDVVVDPMHTEDDTKDTGDDTKDTETPEGVTVQHTAEQKEGQKPESPTKHVVIGKTETTTGGEAVGVGARKKIIKGK